MAISLFLGVVLLMIPSVVRSQQNGSAPSNISTTAPSNISTTAPSNISTTAPSNISTTESTTASDTEATTEANSSPGPTELCPGVSGMLDKTRLRAMDAHNYRRGRLARGEVKNKNGKFLPTAANMRALDYNCTLEASALSSAQRCSVIQDPSLPEDVQENHYLFPKSQASSEEDALIVAVKNWWSQIRVTGGIGQGVTYTDFNVGKPTEWFIRMAWATTERFGCAVTANCSSYWSVVCHYQPGAKVSQPLYVKGTPCDKCSLYDSTFCNEWKMCQLKSTTP